MISQFVTKAHVAIRTLAEMKAINPNVAVGHHSVEVDKYSFVLRVGGEGEVLAIPANTGGKEAAGTASRIVLVEWTLNAPIVWHVEFASRRVVE